MTEQLFVNSNKHKDFQYRLGDVIINWNGFTDHHKKNCVDCDNNYYIKLNNLYPDSIGNKYKNMVKNLKKKKNNYKILIKILRTINYEKPKNDDIVIHLRIGDVLMPQLFGNNNSHKYFIPIRKIFYILKNIKKVAPHKNIILVYGNHKILDDRLLQMNRNYLNRIIKILKFFELKYIFRSKSADEDFYFMCHAKTFIKSNGNYSRIIGDIVKMKNNLVYSFLNFDKNKIIDIL